ncbi:MAG: zinc ribbon domain-containing protein [Pirellulaceae bacterium]|nr:zinc ribbon domain-containing protein [Pirellulaceae bacterium]
MPIYEYVCHTCTNSFELLVRGTEKPNCPKCESSKIEKQLSVPSSPQSSAGSGSLPISGGGDCAMPRCCGGGCQSD